MFMMQFTFEVKKKRSVRNHRFADQIHARMREVGQGSAAADIKKDDRACKAALLNLNADAAAMAGLGVGLVVLACKDDHRARRKQRGEVGGFHGRGGQM